jgi:hypothetical protein
MGKGLQVFISQVGLNTDQALNDMYDWKNTNS